MANKSLDQLQAALIEIATTANTLASFTRDAMQGAGQTEQANQLHIAAMLAERIGALADYAVGEEVVGDQGDWLCGPTFRRREVSHA